MAVLGVDIAKEKFDVTFLSETGGKGRKSFKNNEKGFEELETWLRARHQSAVHICMEATNVYWEDLAQYYHDAGHVVSVVNPSRIKGYAVSQMRRSKTDPIDGDVIADFCATQKPEAWKPPTTEERKLRALVRQVEALKKTRSQHQNRLAVCRDSEVQESIEIIVKAINEEIERLDARIQALIDEHPPLKKRQELLMSIKGYGRKTALHIMAEMYDLAAYKNAKAAAADAGVTASHHSSGTSVHRRPKMSRIGKASVRGALYFPAIVAIRHNPVVKAFAERLRARGKPEKLIIVAAMRKLLHLAYGVLKNETPFDPNYALS